MASFTDIFSGKTPAVKTKPVQPKAAARGNFTQLFSGVEGRNPITKAQRFYTEQDIRQEQGSKLQQGLAGAGEFIEGTAKKAASDFMSIFPKPKAAGAATTRPPVKSMTLPVGEGLKPEQQARAQEVLRTPAGPPQIMAKLPFMQREISLGPAKGPLGTFVKGSAAATLEFPERLLKSLGYAIKEPGKVPERPQQVYQTPTYQEEVKKLIDEGYPPLAAFTLIGSTTVLEAAFAGGLLTNAALGVLRGIAPKVESVESARTMMGLPKNWTEADLQTAYRKTANIVHPDKPTGNTLAFQRLNEANTILKASGPTSAVERGAYGVARGLMSEPGTYTAPTAPYLGTRALLPERAGAMPAQPFQPARPLPAGLSLREVPSRPLEPSKIEPSAPKLTPAGRIAPEGIKPPVAPLEVKPGAIIRPDLEPLAQEARKFKSAEEFVKDTIGTNKNVREGRVGEIVNIRTETFGRKSPTEFNLDLPRQGEIVKINPQSVSIRVGNEVYKLPPTAKISKDLRPVQSFKEKSQLTDFWKTANQAPSPAEVPAIKAVAEQGLPAGIIPRTPQQIAIEQRISPLSPMITLRGREATFLRERLRLLARGARYGALGTKQSVLKTQRELETMVKELMPLEERGKFLTSLRNIQTPAQLAKQMPALTQTMNRLIDAREVRNLKTLIQKELKEKLVKRDAAGVRIGKVTPEAQRELDKIKDVLTMKRSTALDELDALVQAEQNGMMQFSDEMAERVRLLKIAAGDADIPAYKAILADIRSLKETGKTISQLRRQNRDAEIERIQDAFTNSVSGGRPLKPGTGVVPIELPKNDKGLIASIAKMANSIEDYALAGQFLFDKLERANVSTRYLQGPMSRWFKNTYALQSQKEISIDSAHKVIKPALARLFNADEKTAAFRKAYADFMQTKYTIGEFKDMSGQPFKMTFTKNQSLYHWGQQQNTAVLPTYQQTMGWTDDMIEALDKSLTAAEKDFVRFIGEGDSSFFARFRQGKIDGQALDPIYERQFGTTLGRVEGMYIPLARDVDSPAYMQLLQDMAHQISTKPSAIKARVANRQPINLESGLIETVEKHVQQMSHFKAYSEFINQGRRVFTGDLRTAIRQNFRDGDELLGHIDKLFNDMAADGVAFSKSVKWLDNLRGSAYTGFIGANPVSALKQLVSTMAWAGEMPLPKFFSGYADFWANPIAKGRFLINNSANLRARYDLLTFERDARQVMASGDAKLLTSRGANFKKQTMIMTRIGDRLGIVPGGWSYYLDTMDKLTGQAVPRTVTELEQFIKRYPKEHARAINDFDATYNRTQQTGLPAHISSIRRSGSWGEMFTFAQSAPEAQFNNSISTLRALGFFGDPKRIPTGEGLKRLFIYLVAIPAFLQFIADGFEFRKRRQLSAVGASIFTLGFSNYPVFFGQMATNIGRKLAGLPTFDIGQPAPASILNEVSQDIGNLGDKLLNDASLEDILKVLKDAGISLATLKGIPAKPASRVLTGIAGFKEKPDIRRLFGFSDFSLEEQGREKTDDARKIYNRIEALPEEEKQAAKNALSEEDWELYKKGRQLDSLTGAEIYEKVQKLRSKGKEKEVFEFLYSLTESDYKKYEAAKKKAEANP